MDKSKTLTPHMLHVIRDKGTEPPFTGEFNDSQEKGTYLCRQCGLALYRSEQKFPSTCGWASFDDELPHSIRREPDPDGRRTEIVCQRCDAHLGHVFEGEFHTDKNSRHCVNSLSIDFVNDNTVIDTEEAIFAGGCFWGMDYYLQQIPGVLKTEVGYMGGHQENPTYETVCNHDTGHLEVTRVVYDTVKTNYETLCRCFFEIHNPTQYDGQGPDIGEQYKSAIFYFNNTQKNIAEKLIAYLKEKELNVVTELRNVMPFWKAETYHQDYYKKNGQTPYCHTKTKRFD